MTTKPSEIAESKAREAGLNDNTEERAEFAKKIAEVAKINAGFGELVRRYMEESNSE